MPKRFVNRSKKSQPGQPSLSTPNVEPGPAKDATPQSSENAVRPWVKWEPDKNFLQDLKKWEYEHPNQRLAGILDKIDSALESKTAKALQGLIPNVPGCPVPVKGLVEALVCVVQLGIKFYNAKQHVYEFVKVVVEDLTDLLGAFDDVLEGGLLSKAWEDLKPRRDIVNGISKWAHEQLKKHVNSIPESTIAKWKDKLTSAQTSFTEKVLLRIAANEAEKAVQKDIELKLGTRIATGVQYTDQNKQFCHDGTRTDMLHDLESWVQRPSDPKRCYWITGRPGSGKSTLAATYARELKKAGQLCSQYFITRNSRATVNAAHLFTTLSHQLAMQSRPAARVILEGLNSGKADEMGHDQAEALLLKPMEQIAKRSTKPVVVVIDALDELDPVPGNLPSIISRLSSALPGNAKLFITSRPNLVVDVKADAVHVHDLKTDESVKEVRRFIKSRMKEIINTVNIKDESRWVSWGSDVEETLSEKADGLYQYANTSLIWISERVKRDGTACHTKVLQQIGKLRLGALDGLYDLVLSQWAGNDEETTWRFEDFRRVVGCILCLQEPLPIATIIALLDIKETEFHTVHFFECMRSVLIAGNAIVDGKTIPQMHKSFREYITTAGRPQPSICIEEHEAHKEIARACFRVVATADQSNVAFNYAARTCFFHRRKAIGTETAQRDSFAEDMKPILQDTVFENWEMECDMYSFINICRIGWRWKRNEKLIAEGGARSEELGQLQSLLYKMKGTEGEELNYLTLLLRRLDLDKSISCLKLGEKPEYYFSSEEDDIPYYQIWMEGFDAAYQEEISSWGFIRFE